MQSAPKGSKLQQFINYQLRVTIQDGRQIVGKFMAFDKHMNIVVGDAKEFRIVKSKGKDAREEKRTLGLLLLRGEEVVSISIEAPPLPEDAKSRSSQVAPPGPGAGRAAGRGTMIPIGERAPALVGAVQGIGGPSPSAMQPRGSAVPPGMGGPPPGYGAPGGPPPGFPGAPPGMGRGGPPPGFPGGPPPGYGAPPPGFPGGPPPGFPGGPGGPPPGFPGAPPGMGRGGPPPGFPGGPPPGYGAPPPGMGRGGPPPGFPGGPPGMGRGMPPGMGGPPPGYGAPPPGYGGPMPPGGRGQ